MKRHIIRPYILYFLFISTAFVPMQSTNQAKPLIDFSHRFAMEATVPLIFIKDALTSVALISSSKTLNKILYGLAAIIQTLQGSMSMVASLTPREQSCFNKSLLVRLILFYNGYNYLTQLPLYRRLAANAQELTAHKRKLPLAQQKAIRDEGINRLKNIVSKELPLFFIGVLMAPGLTAKQIATRLLIWEIGRRLINMKISGLGVEEQLLAQVAVGAPKPQQLSLSTATVQAQE